LAENPSDEASKEKLQLLLFQLGETLKDPPVVIDIYSWRDSVEVIMEEIQKVSPYAYNMLEDLITETVRIANIHVSDLDRNAPPNEIEQSSMKYFEQVAFVNSEINNLKSM